MKNKIKLYHYTRAIKSSIEIHGLIAKSKEDLRNEFINKYRKDMSPTLLTYFKLVWEQEPSDEFDKVAIWFVSKRLNENDSCIKPLLKMYGGEAISMCADSNKYVCR